MIQDDPVIKTGVSQKTDPAEAVQEIYEAIYQPDVSFAVFYCSPNYDLERLEKALADKFADIPLIGCTTAGEITPVGFLEGSITGVSIRSDKLKSKAVLLPLDDLTGDQVRIAHKSLYEQMMGQDFCDTAVCTYPVCDEGQCEGLKGFAFLLIDGLSNMEERVMGALSEVLSALPLVGGSAADDDRFEQTQIYYEGQFHTNCAVLSLVCTSLPFYLFKTESFEGTDRRLVITEADAANRKVTEINGLPASTGYAEAAGIDESELSFDFFANNPVAVKLGGDYFIRSITPSKEAYSSELSKGLRFSCAIDEGVVLSMAKSTDVVENLSSAFDVMREEIGEPLLTLGFDCLYRNAQYRKEAKTGEIAGLMQENKVIGFHTYGEQYGSLHVNQTFTAVAFGREKSE
jgi:hypothetical protein